MLIAPFKVVLDANVLFPFSLRDTLLRLAADGFYQVYWSELILDEVERNLLKTRRMSTEQAKRLRSAMANAFPESEIGGFESLIDAMPNQQKDRHVAAAAMIAGAQVIVSRRISLQSARP